ncbi:hypothetical protein [Flavobacterium sp.]|uniref:hypothetical protein n=1 Tax=Flavobacterium sp. TaxID=239 RepID=UPI0028BE7C0E|nr:hypothetical protein [Flavobacterium sp.]
MIKAKLENYHFNLKNISEYDFFWINYEFLKKSPKTELNITRKSNINYFLSIMKTDMSLSDIQWVFKNNTIVYKRILNAKRKMMNDVSKYQIEVFKTSIKNGKQMQKIKSDLLFIYPNLKVDFDLEDIDRVLRVEGFFSTNDIIKVALLHNPVCEILSDFE